MQYDNTNTGVLFRNEKTNENQPDYKGKLDVDGREMELAAWIKTSAKGTKFMSLKLSEPYNKDMQRPQQRQQQKVNLDDVPF